MSGKKYKLSVRIPVVIIAAVTVVVFIMCICFFIFSRNTVSALLDEQVDNIAAQNTSTVASYLTSMQVYSEALRDDVLRNRALGKEAAAPMLESALKDVVRSGRVFSAYFAFEPDKFFPDTPDGLSYYAYSDGGKLLHVEMGTAKKGRGSVTLTFSRYPDAAIVKSFLLDGDRLPVCEEFYYRIP